MKANTALTSTQAATQHTDSSTGGVRAGTSAFIVPRTQVSGGTKSRIAAIHKIVRCAIMTFLAEKGRTRLCGRFNLKDQCCLYARSEKRRFWNVPVINERPVQHLFGILRPKDIIRFNIALKKTEPSVKQYCRKSFIADSFPDFNNQAVAHRAGFTVEHIINAADVG